MTSMCRWFGIASYLVAAGASVVAILGAWEVFNTYGLAGGFFSAFVVPLAFFLAVLALPPFLLGRLFMKRAQPPDNPAN